MRGYRPSRRGLVACLVVVALLVAAFEIGVRSAPPDAVEYHTQTVEPVGCVTVFNNSGVITDPAQIAHLRATLTAQPTNTRLWDIARSHLQGADVCSLGSWYIGTYRFTWHGLPVEVVSPASVCGSRYAVSSGGWTDPTTYFVDWPVPLTPVVRLPGR